MAGDSNAELIWNALIAAGATPIQAAGIMGNMQAESGLNPEEAVMDHHADGSDAGYSRGLIMWNDNGAGSGVNWSQYITGNVAADITAQAQLLAQQGYIAAAVGNTPQAAAQAFLNSVERPADPGESEAERVSAAAGFYQDAQSGNWNTTPGPGPSDTQTPDTSQSGAQNYYDSSGSSVPTPPGLQDLPALESYIRQYFGADAWLLNTPAASVLEQAVAEGRGNDTAYLQGLLQQTSWWQTTSQAVQTYEQNKATTPAEFNFNVPGSKAAQTAADIQNLAGTIGVQISVNDAQQLAQNSMEYGWDQNQQKAAIGDMVYYTGQGAGAKTNAGDIVSQLQAAAGQYYVPTNDPILQSWAQNIAGGTQNIQQFEAWLKEYASLKWTGMASQIQQGYTPDQITSSLRTNISNLMEVDPTSVDFVNDPTYSKILDYAPPNDNGIHRIMTQSEADQYLRSQPAWASTQNARDSVSTVADSLLQTLGKVGS